MKFSFLKALKESLLSKANVVILIAIVTLFALGGTGFLDPVIDLLDSDKFSLKFSTVTVSTYDLFKGIMATFLMFWLAHVFTSTISSLIRRLHSFRASDRELLSKATTFLIYGLALLVAFEFVGLDLTALAVLGGAVGLGIGVGLQKITSNFISGIILLFEKSVEINDLVELDDNIFGLIKNLGGRYTLIETFEGKEIMIPNEDFITSRVTNWTYSNERGRIIVPIGVSYNSDLEKVQSLIIEAAMESDHCSKTPAPECYLREYGDSSVNFLLFFWVDDIVKGRYLPQSDVMLSIWRKFKEHNIEIPFPQRDVHLKTDNG